jgi:hypothetical protein
MEIIGAKTTYLLTKFRIKAADDKENPRGTKMVYVKGKKDALQF